ncbi:MAG: hypothetical protein AAGF31_05080 [Planctomycetota bacterium]
MKRYCPVWLLLALSMLAMPASVVSEAIAQTCADCSAACGECAGCQNGSGCQAAGYSCIDGPTPGPCTADGCCRAKVTTWGKYRSNWRRWPGDVDDPIPSRDDGMGREDLPSVVAPIDPRVEDLRAPPASDAAEEEGEEGYSDDEEDRRPNVGDSLPPLPPPRPLGAPPAAPESNDPPPALPPLPGFERPLGGGSSSLPQPVPQQNVRRANFHHQGDLPPALPAGFGLVTPASAEMSPAAGHQAAPIGTSMPAVAGPNGRRLPAVR